MQGGLVGVILPFPGVGSLPQLGEYRVQLVADRLQLRFAQAVALGRPGIPFIRSRGAGQSPGSSSQEVMAYSVRLLCSSYTLRSVMAKARTSPTVQPRASSLRPHHPGGGCQMDIVLEGILHIQTPQRLPGTGFQPHSLSHSILQVTVLQVKFFTSPSSSKEKRNS